MKDDLSRLKMAILSAFFLLLTLFSQSQVAPGSRQIIGRVVAASGQPISGASVALKGTKKTAITDAEGKFKLNATPDVKTLVISHVGMKTQEIQISGRSDFDIRLQEDITGMEQVIVVGYGTQKKASVVGAISNVKGDELVRSGVPSVANALTGLVPGMVTIQQTGLPGAEDSKIYIRGLSSFTGNNQPLVLVDGFERGLNDINPSDVETISVLKDASATAVFGVKGGNGVILITTKRGQSGRMEISATYDQTFKQPTTSGIQEGSYSTLKARDEMYRNQNKYASVLGGTILEHYRTQDMPYIYPDVDSWKNSIRDFSVDRRASVTARGGTKNAKYFISLGYLHEGDLLKSTQTLYDPSYKYDRVNFRMNFDFNLTSTTKFSISSSGYVGSASFGGRADQSDNAAIVNLMLTSPPYLSPYMYPASLLAQYPDLINPIVSDRVAGNLINPADMSAPFRHNYKGTTMTTRDRLATDVELNQNLDAITKGLSFKAAFSYNTNTTWDGGGYTYTGDRYILALIPNGYRWDRYNGSSVDNYAVIAPPYQTPLTRNGNPGKDYVYSGQLNYTHAFHKHTVGALAAANRRVSQYGAGFPHYEENWVGRATYDYDGRYLLETTIGISGSEQFAPGNRFGYFPSVAMGYNLAKEKFFKKLLPTVNNFKLRYSIGQTGNDNTGSQWLYISQFTNWNTYVTGEPGTNLNVTTVREGSVPNINAQWERATKQDLGLEVGLFNNAFTFSADLYDEKRDGILMGRRAVATWFGQSLLPLNIGATKRHGYEMEASYTHSINAFRYWVKANYNFNENRVTAQDDPLMTPDYQKLEGKPISRATGNLNIGYYQDADEIANYSLRQSTLMTIGTDKLLDFNGDATTANDGVPMGHTNRPDKTYGFSAGVMYKNVDASFLIQGASGADRNFGGNSNPLWQNDPNELYIKIKDRNDIWTPDNRNATFANWGSWNPGSKAITNAKYLRLKSAELAYNFTGKSLKSMGLSSARIALQGSNLITYAPGFEIGDPENEPVAELGYQYGLQFYPIPRRYTLALKINF